MASKLFGGTAGNIKSVDFTNSKIETFTPEAFGDCNALKKITFGENCKNIVSDALNECIKLEQIVFEGTTAPTVEKQDESIMKNIIIEVPEGKEKDYQDALAVNNSGATVTAEADILRYTSTESIKKQGLPWIYGNYAKWSETEVPGEIIGKELWASFSWSGEYKGELVSGTFDAKIEKGEFNGSIGSMSGTEVFPKVGVGKPCELLVYKDKEYQVLLFTIQAYSKISEKTEYTDNGFTYCFVNVENPIYSKPTYEGEVVLKSEVKAVDDYAFVNTSSLLTTIKLPQQITSIGNGAFKGCYSLTSIDLPSSVETIDYSVFDSCSGLTSIDLPSSVETIDYNAFNKCSSVTSVICRATTPPSLITDNEKIWFSGLKTDTCQVPTESISVYEANELWRSQFNSFVAIQ